MSTTASFDLQAGANYTLFVGSSGSGYTGHRGVWIDLNGDNDFTDAGDFFVNIPYTGNGSVNITIPCNVVAGNTRMRVRSRYWNYGAYVKSNACSSEFYGETEDYTMSLSKASGLSSDFFVADTSYLGTPVNFVNSNQSGYIAHDWTIDGTSHTTTNVTRVFSAAGTYSAKLVSENCLGKDSTTKSFDCSSYCSSSC
tara:strand:- start:173 stop:763 length:591 start_codon:yes stop_codon:yes gene_type:complete